MLYKLIIKTKSLLLIKLIKKFVSFFYSTYIIIIIKQEMMNKFFHQSNVCEMLLRLHSYILNLMCGILEDTQLRDIRILRDQQHDAMPKRLQKSILDNCVSQVTRIGFRLFYPYGKHWHTWTTCCCIDRFSYSFAALWPRSIYSWRISSAPFFFILKGNPNNS